MSSTNRNIQLVRGLVVLLCAGIINSTAVFVSPLAEFYGWNTSAIANVGTTLLTFWPIGAIVGGKLLQKFSGKTAAIVGACFFGLGLILTAFIPKTHPEIIYVTYSFMIGIGNGIAYCGAIYCVTGWFPDRKGFAAGMCMAFNGGSSAFIAPLLAHLTAVTNIRVTLIVGGLVCAIVSVIAGIGMKNAPEGYIPEGYKASDSDAGLSSEYESLSISKAWKTKNFWLYALAMALFPAFYIIMFSRLSIFMTDKGISVAIATLGITVYNIGSVMGRLGLGLLIDRIGYKKVYFICWICCMLSGVFMLKGAVPGIFLVAYFLLGAGFGATNTVYPVMSTTSFGPIYAGNIYGVALLLYLVCTQVIPRIASASIEKSNGSYATAFTMAFVLCTIGMICGVLIPKLERKRLRDI